MTHAHTLQSPDHPASARNGWGGAVIVVVGFFVAVLFTFMVLGGDSQAATITFDNSIPTDIEVGENNPLELSVQTQPAADTLRIDDVEGPATAEVLGTSAIRIEPEPGAAGLVTVALTACSDGACATTSISAEIVPENDPPVAGEDEATTSPSQPTLRIPVLENDSDEEGSTLSILRAQVVAGDGEVDITDDQQELLFTPALEDFGPWTIFYVVSDGEDGFAQGTVTVSDGDLAPVAVDDAITVSTGERVEVQVLSNDSDDGGNAALIVSDVRINNLRDRSSLEAALVDNRTVEIVAGSSSGVVDVEYVLEDERGRTAAGVIEVTIEPVPPTAADDAVSILEDGSALVDVLANDFPTAGIDPSTLQIISSSTGEVGVSLNDDQILYEPPAGSAGVAEIVYEICNSDGQCDRATLRVDVEAVNDQTEFAARGQFQVSSLAGDQIVPWSIVSAGAPPVTPATTFDVTVDRTDLFASSPQMIANGSLVFEPAAGASGTATVTIVVEGRRYVLVITVS